MGKREELPLHPESIQGGKKLNKRKYHLQERLQKARESKEHAEERLQRMQVRMQKRSARVQRLEEQLRGIYQQLQGAHSDSRIIVLNSAYADSTRIDRQAAQECLTETIEQAPEDASITIERREDVNIAVTQSVDLAGLSEAIVQAQDARYAADVAEEAVCRAVVRVQAATSRLDQSGAARHLEQELIHMQQEIEQASRLAQEKEQAARQAEQLIQPFVLVPVDEENEPEADL